MENTEKSIKPEPRSCIIQNEEVLEALRNALDKYFTSLPEERLLEIESYMSCDSDEDVDE